MATTKTSMNNNGWKTQALKRRFYIFRLPNLFIMSEPKYSESIRESVLYAGSRTYFFDVKKTKADDYYLTITESKKINRPDATHFYKKHKIFLYKEDFARFVDHLNSSIDFIVKNRGTEVIR